MFARSLTYPKDYSFFLLGPRGTGKSTWVSREFSDSVLIDLLNDATFSELATHPNRLEAIVEPHLKASQRVIIDEVQKLPRLLDEVHRLIERRKWKFLLTGSSARKLKRSGANLLAGRARTLQMPPLTVTELGASFRLKHSLEYGHLPSVYVVSDPGEYLKSYVGMYLKEEIYQESLVRDIGPFAKFLEAASFSQASVLNIQNVASDCGLKRKTAENYFVLLEDLLLSVRLPVFQRKAKRKISHHPKFYFFDTGVFRALRPKGPLDAIEEIEGIALETLVFQELRAQISNHRFELEMFFWRSSNQNEVDFVVYGQDGFLAFEVKRSQRFRESDMDDLKLFLTDYPQAKGFLFYGGSETYQFDRITVLPVGEGLKRLPELLKN